MIVYSFIYVCYFFYGKFNGVLFISRIKYI